MGWLSGAREVRLEPVPEAAVLVAVWALQLLEHVVAEQLVDAERRQPVARRQNEVVGARAGGDERVDTIRSLRRASDARRRAGNRWRIERGRAALELQRLEQTLFEDSRRRVGACSAAVAPIVPNRLGVVRADNRGWSGDGA